MPHHEASTMTAEKKRRPKQQEALLENASSTAVANHPERDQKATRRVAHPGELASNHLGW